MSFLLLISSPRKTDMCKRGFYKGQDSDPKLIVNLNIQMVLVSFLLTDWAFLYHMNLLHRECLANSLKISKKLGV